MIALRVRTVLQMLTVVLPWPIRRRACQVLFGWHLHPTSRIGLSIVVADMVVLAQGARIGHLTVIRDLERLELGTAASIGNWNWITAARIFGHQLAMAGTLRIGAESAVTSRHYIDCSGGVRIGEFVTFAGVRSTVLTHQINRANGVQSVASVSIGDRSLISSNVKFAPGASVPRDSLVGMGAVVVGTLAHPSRLYVGVPARSVKRLSHEDAYLHRSRARVGIKRADEPPGSGTSPGEP